MSQELLDLLELIKIWVNDFPLDKSQKRDADELQHRDVNWDNVRILHGPTQYYDQIKKSSPKTHVLFTAFFTNDTDQPQVYTLKTERRTKSTCNIIIEKGYIIGASLEIKLLPPNPVIEANAGFKGEMSVTKADNETFEEELVWSVDNQITVPPKFKTKADLVIKEDEYTSQFQTETKFEGKIHVTLRSKKDNSPITTLTGDVRHIFRVDQGFRVDKTGIYFVSQGKCKCRFGVEQHVKLSQTEITQDDEAK
ncbi:hypothetical protein ACJMK2_040519 [Sinanodonta woodiana]|uniref:Uncharacterized protein n=1 Tax=Sinanodonta woodiana TaxID=1069815 RepID=A0ABD3W1V4_SINWO